MCVWVFVEYLSLKWIVDSGYNQYDDDGSDDDSDNDDDVLSIVNVNGFKRKTWMKFK